MNDAVIILQARMASSRLPGKALASIGARSLVAHCLVRLRLARAARVLLATTDRREDDTLVAAAGLYGVAAFRGPSEDVLRRVAMAVQSSRARFVVRATADNPAVDMDAPTRLLAVLRSTGADYVSEENLPYGAAVEAFTADALERAEATATETADREHVTPLMRRDRTMFTSIVATVPASLQRPDVRLTVDTERDLRFMRRLAGRMANWLGEPELHSIIAAADRVAMESRAA